MCAGGGRLRCVQGREGGLGFHSGQCNLSSYAIVSILGPYRCCLEELVVHHVGG